MNWIRERLATLAARPRLAFAWVALYAVTTITAHERVNQLVRALQQELGPPRFLRILLAIAALLVLGLVRGLRQVEPARRRSLALGLLLWCVAAGAAYFVLSTVVSEGVHYVQYAGLVVLLFPLVHRIGAAMLIANLVGIADEAYQYWILHPDWGIYLDWNDIVLNALGAALGGLLLGWIGFDRRRRTAVTLVAFTGTVALLLSAWAMVGAGKIVLHAGATGTTQQRVASAWLVLDRGDVSKQRFWITADWAQKRYHVLSAAAGSLLVAAFAIGGFAVDRGDRRSDS